MIVDLSSPEGASVNNGIHQELCSLRYASLDNAIRLVAQLGPGTQLVKMNLKDAYCMVPVDPEDQHVLAVSWEDSTYVDRAMHLRLHSAPLIFSAVADTMAWAL